MIGVECSLPGATTVLNAVAIARPMAEVFDFVTTPAEWHRWHPATHAVRGVLQRPLGVGETVIERIAAAGRRFDATWTVEACEPPRLWVIATDTDRGAARITYWLDANGEGCRFERQLQFLSRGWPWRRLDGNLTRWMLARQSARALANLKRVLEAGR